MEHYSFRRHDAAPELPSLSDAFPLSQLAFLVGSNTLWCRLFTLRRRPGPPSLNIVHPGADVRAGGNGGTAFGPHFSRAVPLDDRSGNFIGDGRRGFDHSAVRLNTEKDGYDFRHLHDTPFLGGADIRNPHVAWPLPSLQRRHPCHQRRGADSESS